MRRKAVFAATAAVTTPALAALALASLALFSLGGGLSSCALPTEHPRLAWSLVGDEAGQARLVLAAPQTDQMRLMMTCLPRSGAVVVTILGRPTDPAVVELHSGETWDRLTGAGHLDEATGAMDIDFQIAADDPVLLRLAASGQLTLVLPDRRVVLPNAFAPAHDFLSLCRSL